MNALVSDFLREEAIICDESRTTEFDVMLSQLNDYALRNRYVDPIDPWEAVQALARCGVKLSSWMGEEFGFGNVSLKGVLLEWMKKQQLEKLEEQAKAEAKAARKKTTKRKTTTKRKVTVSPSPFSDEEETV